MDMIRGTKAEGVVRASTATRDPTSRTASITKIAKAAATTSIARVGAIVAIKATRGITTISSETTTCLSAAKDAVKVAAEAKLKRSQSKSKSMFNVLRRPRLMKPSRSNFEVSMRSST